MPGQLDRVLRLASIHKIRPIMPDVAILGRLRVARRSRAKLVARGRLAGEPRLVAYLYLAPGLLLILLFVIVPLTHSIEASFLRWDGISPPKAIGWANYAAIFQDPELRSLFGHSLILIIFFSVIPIGLALLLTALLGRRPIRFMVWYRSILFAPQAVALVVSGIAWDWMYAQDGVVNDILNFVHINTGTAWLGSFTWALPAVGVIGSWLFIGLCLVLFLAGVQKIDGILYDAAQVDGAGEWQLFRYVTFPHLRGEIAVALTLTVIAALRSFDVIYVATLGGPGTATDVPGLAIFQRAFDDGQVGAAASLAVVLTLLIFMVTAGIAGISRRHDSE